MMPTVTVTVTRGFTRHGQLLFKVGIRVELGWPAGPALTSGYDTRESDLVGQDDKGVLHEI